MNKIYILIFIFIFLFFNLDEAFARRSKTNNLYGTGSNIFSTGVNGHFKSNGTYVKSHRRSRKNNTEFDNWSTRGNYNLFTGKRGTKSPRW